MYTGASVNPSFIESELVLTVHCLRAHLSWVTGFTNPKVRLRRILSSLPEFILQAYFKSIDGLANSVTEAIIQAFGAPWVLEQTTVVFIELDSNSAFLPTIREFSKWNPSRPWGITSPSCPTCLTNYHVSARFSTEFQCEIQCNNCKAEGQASFPGESFLQILDRQHLREKSRPYMLCAFPGPSRISATWSTTPSKAFREEQRGVQNITSDKVRHYPGTIIRHMNILIPTQFCFACHRHGKVQLCHEAGCVFGLCIENNRGEPCIESESASGWHCPLHAKGRLLSSEV